MNGGPDDDASSAASVSASVVSRMANRRLESLRRLNETAGGSARRPLSPNTQKQRLEERIRNLQRKDGMDSVGLVRQPHLISGAGARLAALDESDGNTSNEMATNVPRSTVYPQPIRTVKEHYYAPSTEAYRPIAMERKSSEQSVRSFASEDNEELVDADRNLLPTAATPSSSGYSNHKSNGSSHSNSSQHSNPLSQMTAQRLPRQLQNVDADIIQQRPDVSTRRQVRQTDTQEPMLRARGLQNPENIAAINRKMALQQLVQQKILQQQHQLAQQHRHEQQQTHVERPALNQDSNQSARELLIQKKIQQQRELNLQRKAQMAQQLQQQQQQLSQRQMLASQQQTQPHQAQGNKLTLQQQQMLLLQRELKLKRELGRSAHSPMANSLVNGVHQAPPASTVPRRYQPQPHRQPSAQSLQSSQNLSVHGLGRDADYSQHQSQEYRDMRFDQASPQVDAYNHPQYGGLSSPYSNHEALYERSYSQRELTHSGHPGYMSPRMSSTRSISTVGSVIAPPRAPTPPPPSPAEKMVEVSPDFWVRLRGADETWAAVEHDFYAPVTCFGCTLELCCIQDADFVLCPTCRVVSPMNGIGGPGQNGRDGGVGLGFTFESLSRWQSEILMARQQRRVYNGGVFAS